MVSQMAAAAAEVEEVLLAFLEHHQESISSEQWASSAGFDHNVVKDVIRSLHGFGYVEAEVREEKRDRFAYSLGCNSLLGNACQRD